MKPEEFRAYARGYEAGFDYACKQVLAKMEELIAEKQQEAAAAALDPDKIRAKQKSLPARQR